MRVTILDKKRVFDAFFKIDEVTVQYETADGIKPEPVSRLIFERGDAVAGIMYNTDTREAIMVKQWRYATFAHTDGPVLEVVAGMLDEGEAPEAAIEREVLEETGYAAKSITFISSFYVSPGGSSERVFTYYIEVDNAGRLHKGGGLEAESEYLEVVHYTLPQLKQLVNENGIPDAKSIIACNYLLNKFS